MYTGYTFVFYEKKYLECVESRRFMCAVAMKIHISSECKKYLDDLGGWVIERRGIIDIKVLTLLFFKFRAYLLRCSQT